MSEVRVKPEPGTAAANALAGLAGAAATRAPAPMGAATRPGKEKAAPAPAPAAAARVTELESQVDRLRGMRDDLKTKLDANEKLLSAAGLSGGKSAEEALEQARKIRRVITASSKHPEGVDEMCRRWKLYDTTLKHQYTDVVLGRLGVSGNDIVCVNWNLASTGMPMYSLAMVCNDPDPAAPCELRIALTLRPHDHMTVLARPANIEKVSPKTYDAFMDKIFKDANVRLIYADFISKVQAGKPKETYPAFRKRLWEDSQREILTRHPELRNRAIAATTRLMAPQAAAAGPPAAAAAGPPAAAAAAAGPSAAAAAQPGPA